jgi:hypothetical protein
MIPSSSVVFVNCMVAMRYFHAFLCARVYSVHQAMMGVHQAMMGVHQAMMSVHQAMMGVHQAMMGVHQAMMGVHNMCTFKYTSAMWCLRFLDILLCSFTN